MPQGEARLEHQRIAERGHLFTWEDPYLCNTYAIDAPTHTFIVDTYLGPDPMREVKEALISLGVEGKPFIVFNTHADYDHIWGNQAFAESTIITHDSSLRRIQVQGEEGFRSYREHMRGEVKLTPPNLVFRKRIAFPQDGVEIFHTPGHTGDSCSLYDRADKVLLTGDNLESPYPYINLLNLKEYTQSLEEYTKLDARWMIPGHDPPQDSRALLDQNLSYIRSVASGHTDLRSMSQRQLGAHYPNAVRLAELYLEKGDKIKARSYYTESLHILDLLERSDENDARRASIQKAINDID